ncbi:MAG: hypothetical protein ACLFWM_08120 [Actinomycetota bacterium]
MLLPWAVAAYGFGRSFNDNSYLWHVRAGERQIDLGEVLTTDPFSFTMAGEPWRTQSWLAEILYAPLDAWGGLSVAPFITTLCAAVTFLLLGVLAYRRSRSVISVVVYLVATSIAFAAFINPRPVIFSFPLFAAVVVADDDRRLRWALPLLLWLWASVHGSFAIGLAFLGLRAIGRGLGWRRLGELILIGLPTLLTAHGLGVMEILLAFTRNRDAIDLMSEWQTPDLLSLPFLPVFAGFLALIWLAQKGRIQRSDWVLLIPFLALAVSANRAVPPAWIGLAPILGRMTIPVRTSLTARPAGLVLAMVVALFPFVLSPEEPVDNERFPIEAAGHLSAERVFHDDATGGWLIYRQWPGRRVYIDDRAELYGEQMRTFSDVRRSTAGWEEEFERWSIQEALLQDDEPLIGRLAAAGWNQTYQDEDFVVLQRP